MNSKEKVGAIKPPRNDVESGINPAFVQHKDSENQRKKTHIDFSLLLENIPGLVRKPKYLIDLADEDDNEIDFLLYFNGVGMLPRGDIHAITGQRKAGKTTLSLIFITAMLKGEYQGFKAGHKKMKVLIVDTEQNPANVKMNTRRIHKAAGLSTKESYDRLRVLALRPYSWRQRLTILENEISTYRPDYVYVDGISDLSKTTNDEESSVEANQKLMTLTEKYKCGISGVLHLNKGMGNGMETMRGHAGTELGNKATETYILRKCTDGSTEVEQADYRNDQIEKFSFRVSGEGESKEVVVMGKAEMEIEAQLKESKRMAELLTTFKGIFEESGKDELSAGELYELLGVDDRTGRRRCIEALELDILEQIRGPHNTRPYRLKSPKKEDIL